MSIEVTVEGHGVVTAEVGQTLLEVCEEHAIPMECACGGFAACNSCRVDVLSGTEGLSPLRDEETHFLENDGQRLGCQAEVHGPCSIRLASGM